jgi:hypothetical protein
MKKRYGYTKIHDSLFNDFEIMKTLYQSFLPVHIEFEHWNKIWKIHGYSEFFEEIEEGYKGPEYVFIFRNDSEGCRVISVERY